MIILTDKDEQYLYDVAKSDKMDVIITSKPYASTTCSGSVKVMDRLPFHKIISVQDVIDFVNANKKLGGNNIAVGLQSK